MKSFFKDELVINVHKHSLAGVNRWCWCLIDPEHYGVILFGSGFKFKSREVAEDGFKEFAEINNITNYKFLEEQ